jgi:hypothetical protein
MFEKKYWNRRELIFRCMQKRKTKFICGRVSEGREIYRRKTEVLKFHSEEAIKTIILRCIPKIPTDIRVAISVPAALPNKCATILPSLIKLVDAVAVQINLFPIPIDGGRPSILVEAIVLDTRSKCVVVRHVDFGAVTDTDSCLMSEWVTPDNFELDVMTGLSLKNAELSDNKDRNCEFDHFE